MTNRERLLDNSLSGPDARFGFISVIGAPNVGKSTLVNALVGAKVTIVSSKVQTTRVPIRGIAIHQNSQLVFVDTPGIFTPKRRLDQAMVKSAWGGVGDTDIVALVVDAGKGLDQDTSRIIEKLKHLSPPKILIVNKVDRVRKKERLLSIVQKLSDQISFERTFMVSAKHHDGISDILTYLSDAVPAGAWHFSEDDVSDLPLRLLAAEITREKAYSRLHDELPYALTVEPVSWKELRDNSVRIEQSILVEKESQKKIVLGQRGATIKAISQSARHELTEILGRPAHLFLFVKVRQKWADDPERYRELGLEFPRAE